MFVNFKRTKVQVCGNQHASCEAGRIFRFGWPWYQISNLSKNPYMVSATVMRSPRWRNQRNSHEKVHAEETAVWQVLENRVWSVRLDYPVPLATASVLNGYIHQNNFKTYLQQQYHKFFLPLWKWYQILQQRPEIFLAWAWFSCFCLACVKCHFVCICGYHLSQGISCIQNTGGISYWTVMRKGYFCMVLFPGLLTWR